jgi:hypothetical protein
MCFKLGYVVRFAILLKEDLLDLILVRFLRWE